MIPVLRRRIRSGYLLKTIPAFRVARDGRIAPNTPWVLYMSGKSRKIHAVDVVRGFWYVKTVNWSEDPTE